MKSVVIIARKIKRSKVKSSMSGWGRSITDGTVRNDLQRWLLRRICMRWVKNSEIFEGTTVPGTEITGERPGRGTICYVHIAKMLAHRSWLSRGDWLIINEIRDCQMPHHVGPLKFTAKTLIFSLCHGKCFLLKKKSLGLPPGKVTYLWRRGKSYTSWTLLQWFWKDGELTPWTSM